MARSRRKYVSSRKGNLSTVASENALLSQTGDSSSGKPVN